MRAVVVYRGGPPEVLGLEDVQTPAPSPDQARVRLRAAGLNHRDLWNRRGYTGPGPLILGSDGAGVVEAVGAEVHQGWAGREVLINPSLYWGAREDAPGPGYQILGNPMNGTYAEAVVVPIANLTPKPAHLDFVAAAALPLAGLTAWRALFTQGALRSGQTVLLPGIGSGVAGWALMFAKEAGARVIVTSGSEEKLARARGQGADDAVNYGDPDWELQVRQRAGEAGIDLVLDHTGEKTLPAALRLVRMGGRIVFLGATTGQQLILNLRTAFFKQVHLIGTTMGSPREFDEMVAFVDSHRIRPDVHHVFPLGEAVEAHRLMEAGRQYGKIVLSIAE
ncbi:MAG: zinc-binding dehydrogenase [Candidatus Lambdaproteobacteria bacterium]|nr:zinc-binding dehydrogenase [Candidatus Lambdaproteobacteria bacterium]